MFDDLGDDVFDECFLDVHVAIVVAEGSLSVHHPEFVEMASGFGFFCSKDWSKVVHSSVSCDRCFDVHLACLRQEHLFAVGVFDSIEFGAIFGTGGRKDWRVDFGVVVGSHPVISGVDDGVADSLDGPLRFGSEV